MLVFVPAEIAFRFLARLLRPARPSALSDVPCFGIPKPIIVFTRISFGLSLIFCASLIAFSIAFKSLPSSTVQNVPAGGFKTLRDVFGKSQIGRAVNRDVVVVVKINQIGELQMSGKRSRFIRNAFHQIAVRNNRVNKMVNNRKTFSIKFRRQMRLRDPHSDAVGKTLSQRSGRDFHARRQNIFGMSGRF